MTNKFTQEDCTKSIAEFEVILTRLQAESRRPVLDGTPFILAIPHEGLPICQWFVLGTDYDGRPENCFRMQRGFDLCGIVCHGEASAKTRLARLHDSHNPEFQRAVIIHRRDWEQSVRDSALAAVNALKALLPTLPTV